MQLYCIYVVDQYYFVSFFYSILYTTSIEANDILGYAPSIFLFNGLLWVLQILHVLWFIIIIKAAYKAVIVGQVRLPISHSSLNEKKFEFDFDSSAWKNIGCCLFKLFSSILAVNDEKKGNWITNVEFSNYNNENRNALPILMGCFYSTQLMDGHTIGSCPFSSGR